ncbi:UNKNOWN [Stylonychia lemnae]|uniref:Uncharacterized protein n=1 Tax=Stylonychia lemnae TaxID=5949 RepID=A0A078A2V6_STYLE|nr:UNKNOWN [Stylonychia lemnae]|eukprot:CDW76613.1 UNKNOWN [Stylonychia lemnae]
MYLDKDAVFVNWQNFQCQILVYSEDLQPNKMKVIPQNGSRKKKSILNLDQVHQCGQN